MLPRIAGIVAARPETPAGPSVTITNGNGNVDVTITDADTDVTSGNDTNGDVLTDQSGGCCDGDDEEGRCYSVPSGTEVDCSTCIQNGGTRDCEIR